MCIKQWEFEFEFSPANTMRLIPVNFGQAQSTVNQTDTCDSLALAPSALPVLPVETCSLSHSATANNRFHGGYLSNDLEVHTGTC
jgi:hypothetical protein